MSNSEDDWGWRSETNRAATAVLINELQMLIDANNTYVVTEAMCEMIRRWLAKDHDGMRQIRFAVAEIEGAAGRIQTIADMIARENASY